MGTQVARCHAWRRCELDDDEFWHRVTVNCRPLSYVSDASCCLSNSEKFSLSASLHTEKNRCVQDYGAFVSLDPELTHSADQY